jgi:DNA invertase Pin-like site-specific DNA recombinase
VPVVALAQFLYNAPMVKKRKQVVGLVRVSVDNDEKVSPEIQTDQITAFCERRDWDLIEIFVERGKSAGEGKKRPGLDAARQAIRAGRATGLVVAKMDRASRSVLDFGLLLAELRDLGADFTSVAESEFDTSTAIGRAMVQVTMVFAELERERAAERSTDWHRHRTRTGAVPSKAPFGYRHADGRLEIDPTAAALVRSAVKSLLAGVTLAEVQRHWAAAGVDKRPTTIRQTLTSPTLAGVRRADGTRGEKGKRRAERAPRTNDVFVPGCWPAIISIDEHRQILDILGGRAAGRPPAPRKLLTGIAMCTVHETPSPMGARARADGRPGGYLCSKPGCFVSIPRDALDKHVTDRLLAYIDADMWRRMKAGRPSPVVDLAVVEAKLNELAEDWAHDRITTAERDAARAVLLGRVADAESDLAQRVDLPDVDDIHDAWPDLPVEAKRLVIAAFIDHVEVGRGRSGPDRDGTKFAERVNIRWR